MKKDTIADMKNRLISLSLACTFVASAAAFNQSESDINHDIPIVSHISNEYYNFKKYYKYTQEDDIKRKLYDSNYIYFFIDKETLYSEEYIVDADSLIFGLKMHTEIYSLENEQLLVYSDGLGKIFNETYYNYLFNNGFMISINELGKYIEGFEPNSFYTYDEIKEIEYELKRNIRPFIENYTLKK